MKKKMLFVQPSYYHFENTSGIAFLRGYLYDKKISSDVLNFNNFAFSDKEKELIKEISKLSFAPIYSNKQIWDYANKFYDDLKKIFQKIFFDYPYIGISIVARHQLIISLCLAKYVKEELKIKTKIVVGGYLVFSFYEDLINLLKDNPLFDYLVVGEGETPLYLILKQKEPETIPNLIYLKNSRYEHASNLNYREDVSLLPPPMHEESDTGYVHTTRKCYWGKCAFCIYDRRKIFVKTKNRSVAKVISDVLFIQKTAKCQKLIFTDDSMPIAFLEKFSEEVIRKKVNAYFETFVRFENCLNQAILSKASKAGFILLAFGLETANERLSKLINKGVEPEKALEIIDICAKLNIRLTLHFMIGLPTQTKEELQEDLNLMLALKKKYDNIVFGVKPFRLEKGSPIHKNPAQFGVKILESNEKFRSSFDFEQLNSNAISTRQAINIFKDFYLKNQKILRSAIIQPQAIFSLNNIGKKK